MCKDNNRMRVSFGLFNGAADSDPCLGTVSMRSVSRMMANISRSRMQECILTSYVHLLRTIYCFALMIYSAQLRRVFRYTVFLLLLHHPLLVGIPPSMSLHTVVRPKFVKVVLHLLLSSACLDCLSSILFDQMYLLRC